MIHARARQGQARRGGPALYASEATERVQRWAGSIIVVDTVAGVRGLEDPGLPLVPRRGALRMPEGDTVAKVARELVALLRPPCDVRVEDRRRGRLGAWRLVGVATRGKHLLLRLCGEGGDRVVEVHLGLHGHWRRLAGGAAGRPPPGAALVLATEDVAVGCFRTGRIRWWTPQGAAAAVDALGPDLCDPAVDLYDAARRLAEAALGRTIATVLLDQRVVAGIGNVYKSEVLFVVGVHPDTDAGSLGPDVAHRLVATAARLLRDNVDRSVRRTTPEGLGPRLWVYRRAGRPCLRCGHPVACGHTGTPRRVTYWCRVCQRLGDARRGRDAHL